jgi:acylpyruvate hydrolase
MKLGTIRRPNGSTTAAVHHGDGWRSLDAPDLSALLRRGAIDPAGGSGSDLVEGTVLLPLPAPSKVICCGLNYGDHIRETGRDTPRFPTLFAKYADTLVGPEDHVDVPADVQADWEAELAVVVGAPLRHASRAAARDAVFGYTVANDISIRDWQSRTLQWFQGKAWDRTTPLGPVVVTPDEVDPAEGLRVQCWVDGEEVQSDSTATLVFDAPALLSYISTFTVLRPGDVVLTGTPGGVGNTRTPQRFLADGALLETSIEGIGSLRNRIRHTRPITTPEGEQP